MTTDTVEREAFIHAPVNKVWEVLTSPEHIRSWYAFDGAEFDPRRGGAVLFRWSEHGTFHGVVEEYEPFMRFSIRLAAQPGENPIPGLCTLVSFALSINRTGTRVRIKESGIGTLATSAEGRKAHAQHAGQAWSAGLEGVTALALKLAAEEAAAKEAAKEAAEAAEEAAQAAALEAARETAREAAETLPAQPGELPAEQPVEAP